MQHIRMLLVDDDDGFRTRVKTVLGAETAIEIVGEATDGWEAIRQSRELAPQIVLMDIRMPMMNGIDATKRIKQEMPEIKVLVLTVFDEEEYRSAMLDNGADGYILKHALFDELIPTIHQLCHVPIAG